MIHINQGTNIRYVAQVRISGHRRWIPAGTFKRYDRALMAMARRFSWDCYKRGRVLMTADYYDPVCVTEMHK